jgi:inner membrane protein
MFLPLGDAVRDFTYHRSFSHSLLVHAALTPLLVAMILRLHPDTRPEGRRWYGLVFLALATHALLDCFTVYGTQILWPLRLPPESWSTVFIIDPLYSLPLMGAVLAAWRLRPRRSALAGRLVALGLVLSTGYLGWSGVAKLLVEARVRDSLSTRELAAGPVLTTPMPLNTLLWRVVVMEPGGYREGFCSLVADRGPISFVRYASSGELLEPIAGHWPVERLKWFTHGFYSVRRQDARVVVTDLRMGAEPDYVFQFEVGEARGSRVVPAEARQLRVDVPLGRLGWVWRRIWREAEPEP